MKLIVGLGNPGKEYENTRHNIGFMVIDEMAKKLNISFDTKKFNAHIAQYRHLGEVILLMKPQTYMNLSGEAVGVCKNFYHIEDKNIIVIHDDLDLPVGKIRLRETGSAGGQKGMKNIIDHLHTQEINRIRMGIGKHSFIPVTDYVLGKFTKEEMEEIEKAILVARDALIYTLDHSFMATMNQYNKR